jgi:hypothetical protein
MQTPPPFNPQFEQPRPKPGKNTGVNLVLIILAVFVGFCCLLMIGGGVMARRMAGPLMSTAECGMTLGFTEEAVNAYVAKNGHYPDSEKWQDEIQPFYAEIEQKFSKKLESKKNENLKNFFKIPKANEPLVCKTGEVVTGFAFNDELSGKKPDDIKDKSTVVLYEVLNPAKNAHGKYNPAEAFSGPEIFGTKRDRLTTSISGGKAEFNLDD